MSIVKPSIYETKFVLCFWQAQLVVMDQLYSSNDSQSEQSFSSYEDTKNWSIRGLPQKFFPTCHHDLEKQSRNSYQDKIQAEEINFTQNATDRIQLSLLNFLASIFKFRIILDELLSRIIYALLVDTFDTYQFLLVCSLIFIVFNSQSLYCKVVVMFVIALLYILIFHILPTNVVT